MKHQSTYFSKWDKPMRRETKIADNYVVGTAPPDESAAKIETRYRGK